MHALKVKELSSQAGLSVTVAAIYRSAFAGLERDFSVLATLSTYCREHLPLRPVAITTISIAFALSGLAACGTALRLVSKAFGLEEFLFLGAERKGSSAIGTLEKLVLKTHWMTSSLY